MPGTGLRAGLEIAERIRAAIASDDFAVETGGHSIAVTVSAGLAESADDSSAALLRRVDRSKQDGRNRVSVDHARDGPWNGRLADGAIGNCSNGPAKREGDAPARGHRNYRKLTIARGGEVVTTMIGGGRAPLIRKFELAGADG